MKKENKSFFINLPEGKEQGICEPLGGLTDGGVVVNIERRCVNCTVGKCLMFETTLDENGNILMRRFTKNEPEY